MCLSTPHAELALPVHAAAPGQARRFLQRVHCEVHQPGALDEAQLLVTELVTNAVRHGGPPLRLTIECDGSAGMVVRVSDGSASAPVVRDPGAQDESGRGVALVDLISDAWGVDSAGNGKHVWFRLRTVERSG